MKKFWLILFVLALALGAVLAQRRSRGGYWGGFGGESYIPDDTRTPREVPTHSTGTPVWTNAPGFEKDVWTFVRIKRGREPYSSGGPWTTDAPDSDLNLSFRLQQMTSLKTDPNGRFLWLTEKELVDYPFIYMVEPGSLSLTDPEIDALRAYLLNGGFLWLDDFWGEAQWAGMNAVMKRVFPGRSFVELPLDHPIYHCVFEIKSKGQVPNYWLGERSQYDPQHVTWEYHDAEECIEVHHRAIFDDKGRMMVLATHNTDNGDGWEREGEYQYFFEHFSEKIAYPLGINVIFYVMTH
ncbi:MAG: DUF4159 domain-containing protein [Verrucomicrobia bacterium]|nr:DUF4159 domain-containing protein [Verrucomicrobiota bacterium]